MPDGANGGHLALRISPPMARRPRRSRLRAWADASGGLLDARDGALKDALTKLDTMAYDFAGAINTVHQTGFALDGIDQPRSFHRRGQRGSGEPDRRRPDDRRATIGCWPRRRRVPPCPATRTKLQSSSRPRTPPLTQRV